MRSSTKEEFSFHIKGKIFQGKILEKPLDLRQVSATKMTSWDLSLTNPYEKELELELYVVHKDLIDVNTIDKKIISLLKEMEVSKQDNTLCITNPNMSIEVLNYYALKIYSNKLIALPNIKPNTKNAKQYACFKIPDDEKESENLYMRITTLNNYFFEFVQHRKKNNFLEDKIIVLDDIEEYNLRLPVLQEQGKETPDWATWFLSLLYKKKGSRPQKQRVVHKNHRYVKHYANLEELLKKKEVFL